MATNRSKTLKRLAAAAALSAFFAAPQVASASLIYDSQIDITGQGFGANPRLLTTQERGPRRDGRESACVGVGSGGSIAIGSGSCISDGRVFMGNGLTNRGGDEVNPQGDNQKYGIPTLGEMGFKDASDIGLLFNATEPGGAGDPVNVEDITLKFYDSNGSLITAIDGSQNFGDTEQGNGTAGFVFVVDDVQQAHLNSTIFGRNDFSGIRIALETTISGAAGGPESFLAVNLGRSSSGGSTGGTPVPAPAGLALFGLAAVGLLSRRNRKRA